MSSVITQAGTKLNELQQELLGPNYEYTKWINTPSELGMSSEGSLSALSKDVNGLIAYVKVLVSGGGDASKTGKPLGNKFFLKTGGMCKDVNSGKEVNRYIYINNVPDGSIPFITQGLGGTNFSQLRGLVPGMVSSMNVLNPFSLFTAFTSGPTPNCRPLKMETIDVNNNVSSETQFVTDTDILNMNSCWFDYNKNSEGKKVNPLDNSKVCTETFSKMFKTIDTDGKIPPDFISNAFLIGASGLSLYLLYRLTMKNKSPITFKF